MRKTTKSKTPRLDAIEKVVNAHVKLPKRNNEVFKPNTPDMVENPPHYTVTELQPWDVVRTWDLNFFLGNAVKYIARHAHKGNPLEDLKKARQYLDKEIEHWEKAPW